MTRFVRACSFAWLLPLVLLAPACGDDSTDSDPTTSSSSSGGGSPTGTGGAGGEGPSTGGGGTGGSACNLTVPEAYDGAAFDANAAVELAVRGQLFALSDLMKSAESDLTITPTLAELTALYEAGQPSVKDVTTAHYDGRVIAWLTAFEKAAGHAWTPAPQPVDPGGKYGNFIFSAHGTDLRQAVEKGLFTAAFYNHALTILAGPLEEPSIDRLLAAFGAHPSFPGNSETVDPAQNPHPDRLTAQYAERRSPKNPADASKPADPANPGPYFRIKADLTRAKAAIEAGRACDAERDQAITRVMADWERVLFATVIYYLNDSTLKLTKDNPTVNDLAGGLHGYGEAIGFIHGFRGLPEGMRLITDAQIDALLERLGAPVDAEPTSYRLLTDPALEVPNLVLAIDDIADLYSWSQEQVEAAKVNH